jgi:2-dehydro-3-deoxyphosphogluconate aldolase/(4S)-4-hydroxy-2-oxoglutarate aldolase
MTVSNPAAIVRQLTAVRVVPVLRLASKDAAKHAADCLMEAGYTTVEITLTTPGAVALIAELRRAAHTGFLVGAGTVLDADSARACIDAGADYLVTPCLVSGIAAMAHASGLAALIGAFTPGEVRAARQEGADVVKVFPASTGGPPHLAAIHAVYPDIPLCPTGGVSIANMLAYFAAGASLVGVGAHILDQAALAAGDRARTVAHARRFLEMAATARPA